LDAALDVAGTPLSEILGGQLGKAAPKNHTVPFGLLFALTVFLVTLAGCETQTTDLLATGGHSAFGVGTQTAEQDDFINALHIDCSASEVLTKRRGLFPLG
jgi:hypothetical protein